MSNNIDDIFESIDQLLPESAETKTETIEVVEAEERHILVPLDFKVYSGDPKGRKEIVDTYKCDRVKGIIPVGKAKIKADRMKMTFKNKNFFVIETASKITESGKVSTVERIVYQTN